MKITDLSVTLFKWDSPAWTTGKMAFGGERRLGVVTVHTDEGIEGHSFLGSARESADVFCGPLVEWLKPTLVGRNPLDTGAIWAAMWKHNRYVSVRAIGAVDVALWDLAGKVAKLPIHRLLGSCRESVPAYASSAYLPTPEAYVEEALHFLDLGWPAYKIHPHGVPTEDIAICRAVRAAVGERLVLMLDAMWAYNYEEALRVGREVEDLKYFWYEDPLAEDDIYGYVKLHSKLDIPILSTEYVPGGFHGMAPWILHGATDMLRGDVMVTGGITPLMRAAARILRSDAGPNIAAVEFSGWDTHANQGLAGGALDRLLGQLAEGLLAFRTDMGPAWSTTTVVVMTEFGRTARPNGTRGTDHGTAGAGFIIGPSVARSTVFSDWPGLDEGDLFERRDLKPTLDTRAMLKAAIASTFDLTPAQADRVFPGSSGVRGTYELMG